MKFYIDHLSYLTPDTLLSETYSQPPQAISHIPSFQTPPLDPTFPFSTELQAYATGKRLLLSELPFPLEQIQEHYLHGYIAYSKGLVEKNRSYLCARCGNENQHLFAAHSCGRCHAVCVYCRHCLTMGKVSQCTPLLEWRGPNVQGKKVVAALEWTGTLSPAQQVASSQIASAVAKHERWLVWAVCGAGKTEILFEGLNEAVAKGQQVLIATPRSDVVLELAPRLKRVFPSVVTIALYGGSDDRGKQGQIVIATTHQVLRYHHHFDFVVIDEVDAFPFTFDPMLKYAVEQAVKPTATTIYLTATPTKEILKQVEREELQVVKIPKRFHGFPLPVPTYCWVGNWRKQVEKATLPNRLSEWLQHLLLTKQQAFLFVPSVIVLQKLLPLVKKLSPEIEAVHAEDKERREKVQQFRERSIQILVTTTILERGVTVPNVAVAVLGADDDVFTESALVQIAGRVGRSPEFPTGDIIFFHYGRTKAMNAAISHIKDMNRLGGF